MRDAQGSIGGYRYADGFGLCAVAGEMRRIGKFSIDIDMVHKQPDLLKTLFGKMIIFRAECLYHKTCIEYVAESEMFDPVDDGAMVPEYDIRHQDGEWRAAK